MSEPQRRSGSAVTALTAVGVLQIVAIAVVFGSPLYNLRRWIGGPLESFRYFYVLRNAVVEAVGDYGPTMLTALGLATWLVGTSLSRRRPTSATNERLVQGAAAWWIWILLLWALHGSAGMIWFRYHGPHSGPGVAMRPWELARGHYLALLWLLLLFGASWSFTQARGRRMPGTDALLGRGATIIAMITAEWLYFLIVFWSALHPRIKSTW